MKEKTKRVITLCTGLAVLILLVIISVIITWLSSFSPNSMSNEKKLELALKIGRLSNLPDHNNFIIDGTSNPFSSTFYFRFSSQTNEIQEFISNSPGLSNSDPQELIDELKGSVKDTGYTWFDIESIVKGKFYQIPQNNDGCYGAVYFDEINNIVYVTVSRS